MSKQISLFSGYSQKENRTTNYCLLVLKLLYEENPKLLSEVLGEIFGDEIGDVVGVHFRQQQKRGSSVPDGLICQKGFTIYLETKSFDWFYDDQLHKHIEALSKEGPGLKILLALGNIDQDLETRFEHIRKLCHTKYSDSVVFESATFDDFLEAIRARTLPKNLADSISDFAAYLDEMGLLASWQSRLDVVNCAGSSHEQHTGNVYMCPATGGAYNHKRSKYFGLYKGKKVSHVALIQALVEISDDRTAKVLWKNCDIDNNNLKQRAREQHEKWRATRYPQLVFLLGPLCETAFFKDTPRGLRGTKIYFRVKADSAEELAEKLSDKKWSEWHEN